ncbi:MAG TPA: glycosyltransferase [Nitrososphaeraceae archaeon]|nr:glycosyltransferase [Nitrososphaeraceae archaeon]
MKEEKNEGLNKSIYVNEKTDNNNYPDFFPFISILIASYNEYLIIERLLSSLSKLSYNYNRFETIIVDDSDDETFDILKKWQKAIPNLKVIHRQNRDGWKGGALNVAINNLDKNSNIVLIVDADNILEEDTLDKIARYFRELEEKELSTYVIQGYPKSIEMYDNNKNRLSSSSIIQFFYQNAVYKNKIHYNNSNNSNWVSRGLSFRLYQRNLVEFIAKEKLNLPLQITGSLFAIRTIILKAIKFSNDICEDWDLTLDIYLSEVTNNLLVSIENNFVEYKKIRKINYDKINNNSNKTTKHNGKIQKIISFRPILISYSEVTYNIIPYFRQRMRVSEGHTRGFRKKIIKIVKNKRLTFFYKLELFFLGLKYAKYIFIIFLVIIDFFLLFDQGINGILTNDILKISFGIQGLSLIIYIIYNMLSLKINYKTVTKEFTSKDMIYLLLLNICTIPAIVIGSFLGFIRSKGNFYRTKRNE